MDETHPGVRVVLENGALTVRRTKKAFSRAPVDLTLEQTVNADAASRKGGLTHFSSSVAFRKRWMITHSVRTIIMGKLLEKAGIQPVKSSVQETKFQELNVTS